MSHILLTGLTAALLALPAAGSAAAVAQLGCTFQTECFETEPCAQSGYALSIALANETDGDRAVQATAADGTFPGSAYALGEDGWLFHLVSDFGPMMVTVHADQARMSVHGGDDAMMVNYARTCLKED